MGTPAKPNITLVNKKFTERRNTEEGRR